MLCERKSLVLPLQNEFTKGRVAELGKQIFVTVKPRFTSVKLKLQYSHLHSNAILNIKMYSCISLGLEITQIKIFATVKPRFMFRKLKTQYSHFHSNVMLNI
jgi:hypothetical protein